MTKMVYFFSLAGIALILALGSCSPVTMSSWTSPKAGEFRVTTVFVWAMFDKLENEKTFEDAMVDYLQSKGIKAIPALSVIQPSTKYQHDELARIIKGAGANSALIFTYKGADKTETYEPPTTTVYPEIYYNYYNYYNYSYASYWGSGGAVTSPGYWTTSMTLHLTANLYASTDEGLIYTSAIQITDPTDVQSATYDIARALWSDWGKLRAASKKK
jgi:hypothetical protein